MWGIIKKALNGTVGTSEFKPLDELIRYDGKVLAPDDDVFAHTSFDAVTSIVPNGTVTGTVVDMCSVRVKVGGSFTVSVPMSVYLQPNQGNTIYPKVLVYINDVYYGAGTGSVPASSGTGTRYETISVTVPFEAGDKISFKLQATIAGSTNYSPLYSATCSQLNILARTVDNVVDVL